LIGFLFIALVLALLGALVCSAAWAKHDPTPGRALAVGLACFTALAGAAILTLVAWVVSGLRCDEGCVTPPANWRADRDAWQWDAIGVLGFAGLALTMGAVVLTVRWRGANSWLGFLAPAACYLAALALYSSEAVL
jgi:hypothetical protein